MTWIIPACLHVHSFFCPLCPSVGWCYQAFTQSPSQCYQQWQWGKLKGSKLLYISGPGLEIQFFKGQSSFLLLTYWPPFYISTDYCNLPNIEDERLLLLTWVRLMLRIATSCHNRSKSYWSVAIQSKQCGGSMGTIAISACPLPQDCSFPRRLRFTKSDSHGQLKSNLLEFQGLLRDG